MEKNQSTAIVTGGTKGLGRLISLELAQAGFQVIAIYGHDEAAAREFREFTERGKMVVRVARLDLQSLTGVDDFFKSLNSAAPLEVLVNNASPSYFPTQLHKWEPELFASCWQVNVNAAFRLSQLAIPLMKKLGRGRIVNILSSNVLGSPTAGSAGYTVAKYGLLGLNKMLAVEYAKFNITANAISPAAMNCGIFKSWPESLQEMIRNQTPNKSVLSAEKIAEIVRFVVSPACDSMNGANIPLTEGAAL